MKKWKTIGSETVFDNKFMVVKKDRVETSDGTKMEWFYVNNSDGTVIIPVTPDKKIITLKQYRYTINDFGLEIPAGAVDSGETPEQTARRELKEETGYVADELIKIGEFYEAYSYAKRKMHVFLARVSTKGKQKLERGSGFFEDIETVAKPFDELLPEITKNTTSAIFPAALFMLKQRIDEGEIKL